MNSSQLIGEQSRVDRRDVLRALGAGGVGVAVGSTSSSAASGPTAAFDATPVPPTNDESITFDATASTNATEYEWYLRNWAFAGDYLSSPTATGQTFSETLADDPWGVKLVVRDADGNTDSVEQNFVVQDALSPTPVITRSAESDDRHAFSGRLSTTPRGSIESYDWYYRNWDYANSFLDSPSATGPDFSERFSNDHWKIKLVVTDTGGRTAEKVIDFYPE